MSQPRHPRSAHALPSESLSRRRRRVRPLVTAALVVASVVIAALGATAAEAQFLEPVAGEVVDGFRPPAHLGAPGNRGWEYRTAPGSPVLAASAGVVVFAGPIGGARYVSIQHGRGLRTTYSLLATIEVAAGDVVTLGARVGTTAGRFHFGVRRGDTYLDPAGVLGGGLGGTRVRLVPVESGRPRFETRPWHSGGTAPS